MTENTAPPFGEWQPIETAPRDGTYVLVWPPTWNGLASCARFDSNEFAKKPRPFWYRSDSYGRKSICRDNQPTHWMPLPAAPTPQANDES